MSDELETNGVPIDRDEPAPEPDELATITAQLEAERATLAAARATLTEKDNRISELETQLGEVHSGFDAQAGQMAKLQEANTQAVVKYLHAVRAANAAIPADVITGDTIEAIDVSLGHAQTIADAVRATLAGEAKNARVPAGAPTRVINLDGLTPKEKIALGIQQQKGGINQ